MLDLFVVTGLQNGDLVLMCELTVVDTGYNLKGFHIAQMLRDLE